MKTHTQLVKRFFTTLLFSTLLLVFPNSPVADSFEDGVQAYEAGDYKKALEIFTPLAEQGDASAQHNLGVIYEMRLRDYAEANKWYLKSFKQQSASMQYIGEMYVLGQKGPQGPQGHMKSIIRAAERGSAIAQNFLGLYYEKGLGVPQDYAKAIKWYRKAAEQGEPRSQHNLGVI